MLESTRVLITGAAGQLGHDLKRLCPSATALTHNELDIEDKAAVQETLVLGKFQVVFNCAAYHVLDKCELNPERAFAVNAKAAENLAIACTQVGAKLIHFSTNYVFDGQKSTPYVETDTPNPLSVYAKSKLEGEKRVMNANPTALVVRTAGLYGAAGNASKHGNFVQRLVKQVTNSGSARIVIDQIMTPTYTLDLARAVVAAVSENLQGLIHITNSGECSWFEFSTKILQLLTIKGKIEPVTTEELGGIVKRPKYSTLATLRANELKAVLPLRHWEDALRDYLLHEFQPI
jgi:dTDP-4-dehydrorhamnose reductase